MNAPVSITRQPVVALVGNPNAGKTSLFNALTGAGVFAENLLFATLDTTTRQLYLGEAARSVSLSDTVGFIRDLPHGLVDAFRATLQEAVDADLLLHIVDAANPDFSLQIEQVQRVLTEIGADKVPQILVFNKIDALAAVNSPLRQQDWFELDGLQVPRIFVSARSGDGIAVLRSALANTVSRDSLAPADRPDIPFLHEEGP